MNTIMQDTQIKKLNESMGWVYGKSPEDDMDYWCVCDDGTIFTAIASKGRVNGWYNKDTWEDFNHDVIAYHIIQKPLFKV